MIKPYSDSVYIFIWRNRYMNSVTNAKDMATNGMDGFINSYQLMLTAFQAWKNKGIKVNIDQSSPDEDIWVFETDDEEVAREFHFKKPKEYLLKTNPYDNIQDEDELINSEDIPESY